MQTTKFTLNIPSIGYKKDLTLDVRKGLKIDLKANKEDVLSGEFGFDELPNKNRFRSTLIYNGVKNWYLKIDKTDDVITVNGEEYIPNWISLERYKPVKLNLLKTGNDNYTEIAFEKNDNFQIEPQNIKNARTVKITYIGKISSNPETTRLLIKGDNKTIVGALNVFHPEIKNIKVEWGFVEINNGDIIKLGSLIDKTKIEKALIKGLTPSLIKPTIININPKKINISRHRPTLIQKGHLKRDTEQLYYINRGSKKNKNLKKAITDIIEKIKEEAKYTQETNKINIYFINKRHFTNDNNNKDFGGGITETRKGCSFLLLDDDMKITEENIIHEVMHTLGLTEIFDRYFKKGKTNNYMDYQKKGSNIKKEITHHWQWKIMRKY